LLANPSKLQADSAMHMYSFEIMVLQIRQESTPAIKQKKPLICLRFDLLSFIDYDPEYNKLMLKLDVNINL
jgi:hypothetical protein